MRVGVLGINYKSSDLQLREFLAKACQTSFGNESFFSSQFKVVLLSTCNRTEIYFSAEDLAQVHSELLAILRGKIELPFEHKLYSYFGVECFAHLATVTSGLDSVIIAETEIQKQVKTAYENACLYYTLPSCLHFMFQKCLKIGKEMRSSFPLSRGGVTLEGMIFHLSKLLLKDMKKTSVFFLGNSEINRKILSYFVRKGVGPITLCTRAPHSAKELKDNYSIQLVDWSSLSSWKDYDLVICATNQQEYLLFYEQADFTCKTRLVCDLGIPRNADPYLKQHPGITLFNVEELGRLIDQKQDYRKKEIESSAEKIRFFVEKQFGLFHNKQKKDVQIHVETRSL